MALRSRSASPRFTPAYAGKMALADFVEAGHEVHPRIRGEDSRIYKAFLSKSNEFTCFLPARLLKKYSTNDQSEIAIV